MLVERRPRRSLRLSFVNYTLKKQILRLLLGKPRLAQDFACGLPLRSRPQNGLKLLKFCKPAFGPRAVKAVTYPAFLGVLTVFPDVHPLDSSGFSRLLPAGNRH